MQTGRYWLSATIIVNLRRLKLPIQTFLWRRFFGSMRPKFFANAQTEKTMPSTGVSEFVFAHVWSLNVPLSQMNPPGV